MEKYDVPLANEITLTRAECEKLSNLAEEIMLIIAHAEGLADGREVSYAMRREEIKVIQFPSGKEADKEEKQHENKKKRG